MPACLPAHESCLREFRSWLFVTTPALSLSINPVNEWWSLSKCEPGVKTHRAQSLLEIREGTFFGLLQRDLCCFSPQEIHGSSCSSAYYIRGGHMYNSLFTRLLFFSHVSPAPKLLPKCKVSFFLRPLNEIDNDLDFFPLPDESTVCFSGAHAK
jgi:hypothetical protein